MIHFLALQSTYHAIEYALYSDAHSLHSASLDKMEASSRLIPSIEELLVRNHRTLQDLSFITVNRGPAPFTTLRTLIATVNGIQYASALPLIGIDGFDAWFCMLCDTSYDTAIIMNAFNQEIYIALRKANASDYSCWYGSSTQVIEQLQKILTTPLIIAGNAVNLYRALFEQQLPHGIICNEIDLMARSLDTSALLGLKAWHTGKQRQSALMPLYLKTTAT